MHPHSTPAKRTNRPITDVEREVVGILHPVGLSDGRIGAFLGIDRFRVRYIRDTFGIARGDACSLTELAAAITRAAEVVRAGQAPPAAGVPRELQDQAA